MIAAGGEEQATGVYVLIRSGDGTYLSSIPTEEKEAFPVLVTRSTEEPPQELETWQVLHLPSPSSASACFALMTYDGKRALVPKGYDVVVVSLSANEERRYEWQLADEAGSTGDKIDRVEQSIAFKSASEGRYLASSKETEQGGGQVLMDEKPFAWSVQLLASMEDCREHRSSSLQYTASLVFSETPKVDAEDIVEELLHGKGWAVIQDAVPIELIQETRRLLMGQTMVRQAKPLDGVHRWTWRAEMGARQRRVRSVLPLGEVFHHLAVVPLVLDACYKILGEVRPHLFAILFFAFFFLLASGPAFSSLLSLSLSLSLSQQYFSLQQGLYNRQLRRKYIAIRLPSRQSPSGLSLLERSGGGASEHGPPTGPRQPHL
ncbi:Phytanoyl-CoA dioxygenase, variant 2 [Balamuthia mandrillaris]